MPAYSRFHAALETLLHAEARPEEKFGHQPRLYVLTRKVGIGLAYDEDIVCAAAYLHDLGVFVGRRPEDPRALSAWDHVAYAVTHAPGLLAAMGFPQEKLPGVLEAIRTHQPKDTPHTMEGTILRDADILEQLGGIGILRTAAKVGRDTRFLTFTDAVASLEKALNTLPGAIRLPATRALAEPRIAALRGFLAAVHSEAGELLY